MARTLGAPLHLVSVWETKLIDMAKAFQRLPHIDWQHLQLEALSQSIRNKIQSSCDHQLEHIAREIDPDLTVTRQVVTAKYPAQGLLAEAEKHQASLILLGSGTKADNYFTQSFSTPLSTMAETVVPVLVVGPECQADFSKQGLRVVLADDLRDTTFPAMQKAATWLIKLDVSDLLHVHIEELSLDRARQILGTATVELRSTLEWEKLSSDLMHALDVTMRERLQGRIPEVKAFIESKGGTLRTEVRRCPHVRDEIERAADEFKADLIIFGRHQKVHQRPYMVGRVTYQAMISQKRAVMVIP
jgi:nucleotide-binding universal stress UspA family protein